MTSTLNLTLNLQEIYEDEYLKVRIDENLKLIHVAWLKHPQSEIFRELFSMLATYVKTYKIAYWISDARSIHYIEFADQNWLLQNIAPFLNTTTVKKFARISTRESLALMDVPRIYSAIEQLEEVQVTTQFEVFLSMEDALDWVLSEIE